jgi:hypothetical protein
MGAQCAIPAPVSICQPAENQVSICQPAENQAGKALGIVYRTIATHLTHKAGYTNATAHTGAVTLIQRFGSALNLNIHLMCMDARMPRAHGCAGAAHILFLDGVYVEHEGSTARFRWVKAPTDNELTQLIHTIAHRLARYLERQGLLEQDAEHGYLALESADEDPMDQLRGHSITYRIAVGPQQGRKVFTLLVPLHCPTGM